MTSGPGGGVDEVLPLAPLQEGLLYHAELGPGEAGLYVVQLLVDLEGGLDRRRLQSAAQALVDDHANLRAGFVRRRSGEAVQAVVRDAPVPWRFDDLSGTPEPERGRRAEEVADGERRRPFDPARPPLVRFALVALGAERHRLVVTVHHLVVDGWSLPLLVAGLVERYGSGARQPPAAPYRDHLAWLATRDRAESRAVWRQALDGVAGSTRLSAVPAGGRGGTTGPAGGEPAVVARVLPAALVEQLTAVARRHRLTLNTVFQGAWGLLLGAATGRDDVVFGATVAGR
ncbi:MAG: condensation domain-containing protein, partial [Actinomycetota bacterium]